MTEDHFLSAFPAELPSASLRLVPRGILWLHVEVYLPEVNTCFFYKIELNKLRKCAKTARPWSRWVKDVKGRMNHDT